MQLTQSQAAQANAIAAQLRSLVGRDAQYLSDGRRVVTGQIARVGYNSRGLCLAILLPNGQRDAVSWRVPLSVAIAVYTRPIVPWHVTVAALKAMHQ